MTALRLPSRRAAAAIAAVGIVLAAAAGGVDVLQGSRYDASTIVFLAQVFPSQTAANAASIADDLETAVRLPASRQQITRSTRITASALRSGLSLGEIGTSASVRIGYKGTSAAQAAAVATTAARVGLTALADVQVQGATDQVTAAQQTVSTLSSQLGALASRLGVTDVVNGYTTLADSLSTEEAQEVTATGPAATTLADQIAADQRQLARLGAVLPKAQQIAALLAVAQTTSQNATSTLIAAQGALSEATNSGAVTAPEVNRVGRAGPLLRVVIGTFVVTVAVLVVLAELLRRRLPRARGFQGRHARREASSLAV